SFDEEPPVAGARGALQDLDGGEALGNPRAREEERALDGEQGLLHLRVLLAGKRPLDERQQVGVAGFLQRPGRREALRRILREEAQGGETALERTAHAVVDGD